MQQRQYQAVDNPHDGVPANELPPARVAAQPSTPGGTAEDALAALDTVQPYLLSLMLRNVASNGFSFRDQRGSESVPGCIIASPSYAEHPPDVDQDYVYNWTRDSALTVLELHRAGLPAPAVSQTFTDYVHFARLCQQRVPEAPDGKQTVALACQHIDGAPRGEWSLQGDGPALQTLAVLQIWDDLAPDVQRTAADVVAADLDWLLANYQSPSTNLWEEVLGQSLFTRAVQLRCFREVARHPLGTSRQPALEEAVNWLAAAIDQHWDGTRYLSVLAEHPGRLPAGYDPNIDVVLAALVGDLPVTEPRLLATAAEIRSTWSDPASDRHYPINLADAERGLGPLIGRYPGDLYDGDVADPANDLNGHPWPVCTAAVAELYYRVAAGLGDRIAIDPIARPFYEQVGITAETSPDEAAARLTVAADRMLAAILFHSDHYQLSEQFDGITGFEKSVANLTWSYAAFLSAERARRAVRA